MEGKREALRQGKAVELEPGVQGRLNKQNRTLELSNGKVLPISKANQRDLFPENESARQLARSKEEIESGIQKSPFGEFGYQLGQSGAIGGIKDWGNRFLLSKPEYQQRRQAEQEVSQRISKESPFTSGAATVTSMIPEIALTKGMSAAKAAPLLVGASAGSRVLDEPLQVAGEMGIGAGLGKGLDKATQFISKIAARRGASRALPGQQQAVQEQNALGAANVGKANAEQQQAFTALSERIDNENAARLHQYNLEVSARENRMIEAKNTYESAKTARDAEVIRLKNEAEIAKAQRSSEYSRLESEYKAAKEAADIETKRLESELKTAQQQYQEAIKQLPEIQKKAQSEYSANVVKSAQDIENSFPKDSRILTDELGVKQFINENISQTGFAGSKEAGQAKRFLSSLFPEGEIISGKILSRKYKAIEEGIQRSSAEVKQILSAFKEHLGQRLPTILEDSIAYNKIVPKLGKSLDADIRSVFNQIPFLGKGAQLSKDKLMNSAIQNAQIVAKRDITPFGFMAKLNDGELSKDLANKILTVEDFLLDIPVKDRERLIKTGLFDTLLQEAQRKHEFFVSELSKKLEEKLSLYAITELDTAKKLSRKLGKDVTKTFGVAPPVEPPIAPSPGAQFTSPLTPPVEPPPIAPMQMPPPVAPPQALPMPTRPNLLGKPMRPNPQSFTPQPMPSLSPAAGGAEQLGDMLEKNLLGGKGLVNNPLTKLAGLKYLLGGAAIPVEAAYLGMKGLTSPTAAGEVARMSFKQGGIQAIDLMAQKYPSYHDGILESPQERRSLTKEIEDDPEIPIEQKAIIQSKVNRGKPLQQRL